MKKVQILIMFTILMTVFTACDQKGNHKMEEQESYKIYYLNNTRTSLVGESYTPTGTTVNQLIEEIIGAMQEVPKNLSYKTVLPNGISIKKTTLDEDGMLSVDFDSNYGTLTGESEVLCRVAIVKNLCQIEGVDEVSFSVDGIPLMDHNNRLVGFMSENDIIDNTGGENAIITLYFANKKGNKLSRTRVRVNYDGTVPLEEVIIKQLIQGPGIIDGLDTDTLFSTIPKGTQLLKTTTKGGVCSVYFNEKFLDKLDTVTEEVAIYSVVNSLWELSSVNKVQFYINGELVKTFKEYKGFDQLFDRNLDILDN